MMKNLISVAFLLWHCHMILGNPGVVDSPEIRKRAISTKLSSYNSVGSKNDSAEKQTSTFASAENPASIKEFEPLKITHEDVITGGNSVYGSHSHSSYSNGGIIFAIGQNVQSTPIMSAAHPQPVLLQYLSPEGMPKQTAVQYVQLLRPLMVVPSQSYLSTRSIQMDIQTESPPNIGNPTSSSFGYYSNPLNKIVGAYSAPLTSYVQSNARAVVEEPDIGLNMNEYVPAASSRISTSVLTPQVTSMAGFKPSKFSMIAQRA